MSITFLLGVEYNDFNVNMKEYYLRVILKFIENNNEAYSKPYIKIYIYIVLQCQ